MRAVARCSIRCALKIGLDRGRLGGIFCRCAVGIGEGRVVSDALCRWAMGIGVFGAVVIGERVIWVVCKVVVLWGLVGGVFRCGRLVPLGYGINGGDGIIFF